MSTLYDYLLWIMPVLAVLVFIILFFKNAGYGIFHNNRWGITVNNRAGWIVMEFPAFAVMAIMASTGDCTGVKGIFLFLFLLHYFQRTFVFPLLMKGKSRMPLSIAAMGVVFNTINAFMIGFSIFHIPDGRYTWEWATSPFFMIGVLVFLAGMVINIHSDSVIRNLRKPGDTRHYLPQKGLYRLVTSGNYFGELLEWVGFALLTNNEAAWIFVLWTFANLAPRAYAIRNCYRKEFGAEAVGNRKCLIPFLF